MKSFARSRVLMLIFSLTLILLGGAFLTQSLSDREVEEQVQMLEQAAAEVKPVIASPNQKPEGPVTSTVKKGAPSDADGVASEEMSPEKMESSTLYLPSVQAYAEIDPTTGKIENGTLTLPSADKVTIWDGGSKLGDKSGSMVVAGHVNEGATRGALFFAGKLKAGNLAFVKNSEGKLGKFQLESLEVVKKSALPARIWEKNGPFRLHVVTCGGELNKMPDGEWHFDSNVVATFKPVS